MGVPSNFYRGPRGPPFPLDGVPSMFYRGPRGPPFPMEGFPPCFTGVRGNPCSNGEVPRMFYKGFPQFCRGLLLRRQGALHIPYGPLALAYDTRISLLVGRKRVGLPQSFLGSPPHAQCSSQKDGPRQASAAKSCFCHADLVKRQQLSQKVGPALAASQVLPDVKATSACFMP